MLNKSFHKPPLEKYRELTTIAVLLGILQGVILNIAFVYSALKLGFSISGSAIAAILGYVILRGMLRVGTIVENNINQTVASTISSAGTGVVFVLPALFLLSVKGQDNLLTSLGTLMLASISGAILGGILVIPLRNKLIEIERLRFPTGIAIATIIRAGGVSGFNKAKLLGIGFLISALWKLILILGWLDYPGVIKNEELNLSFGILPAYLTPALYLSLMNFAVGLLSGRAGLPFLFGGILAWWIISPFAVFSGWVPITNPFDEQALVQFIYDNMLRPLGIGILIGAAFTELIVNFPAVKGAIQVLISAARSPIPNSQTEIPLWVILSIGGIALILFFLAIWNTPNVTLLQATLVTPLAILWMGLAGLIVAQCTGLTDISPVSGISLISLTLMMIILNGNLLAAMVVTITVAVAIGQSADMMQDLKTGFLVGSRPFRQQIVQITSSWLGVILAFATLYLLWHGGPNEQNGFGAGTNLPAPQATVLKSMIESVQTNTVPFDKLVLGSIAGLLLGVAPLAGLGVLTGLAMYLPFSITLGYGLGCLTEMIIVKKKGRAFSENKVVPLAAGLLIGEALMGVGYAIWEIIMQSTGSRG
jgi:putative OPT family oligopeptide transporter